MNIYDIMDSGNRVIIYADEERDVIYTWNKSFTLQQWTDYGMGEWDEINVCTLAEIPTSLEAAQLACVKWIMND